MADLSPLEITRLAVESALKSVNLEDRVAREVKLRRTGRELRGACPFCGAGQKSDSPPFAVNPHTQRFVTYCECEKRGDVVDFERALNGGSVLDAARRLTGDFLPESPVKAKPKPKTADGPRPSDLIAAEMWDSAQRSVKGTLAERYLRNRGISGLILQQVSASPNLRFHPHAKWGWIEDRREWLLAPAMITRVVTASGATGGIHATYLSRTGWKADLQPAKRMWGAQNGPDGSPGGAWLIGPEGEGDLVAAEGIETALSVAMLAARAGRPIRACAALSLNRLQGGLSRDDDGCVDPFDPKPDLDRPPFTWPSPAENPWSAVLIAVDRDMSPIRLKAKTPRGRICEFRLESEARARLCSRLATAAWLRAGATPVRAIAPPPGSDFNNELVRVLRGAA